ncbi:MAG: hypothetical protein GEV07_04050 [Streptosporangiales bacterium]|nr:hypothetical protein [Streptosporangiales bacterium]
MSTLAPERAVASFDSASAFLRVTAHALRGESFPHLGRGRLRALPTRYSTLLPRTVRRTAYGVFGGVDGIPARRLGDVDMETVAQWVVEHYGEDSYPGVVIGSPNGAAAHLCAETGMPFLPQTLLIPVRWEGNDPDHGIEAMERGRRIAGPLLENNPGIVLHHMHDGNQDRLMIQHMTYFRLKWRQLPAAYERFLAERLAPEAPIIFLADDSTWPTTRIDDRHFFQAGARGGLNASEYTEGSPRVASYLQEHGSAHTQFQSPKPDGVSAEAEWGFDARIADDISSRASELSHPVVTMHVPEPQALSGPTARLLRQRFRDAGADGDRLVVESFLMVDPVEVRRSGSVPFWSYFPVEESLTHCAEHVERAARAGDPYRDVDVLLFPHGVASVGATSPKDWAERLRDHISGKVRFVSGTPERWPAHFDALAKYGTALGQLADQPQPGERLPVEQMLERVAGDAVRLDSLPERFARR